jgi:hypothetical protein
MQAPKAGEPLEYYHSRGAIRYAIELSAGAAAKMKLAAGQVIALPDRIRRILAEPD